MKKFLLLLMCVLNSVLVYAQFPGTGKGTSNNPYLIYTATQLDWIRSCESGDVFKLMADIDLTNFIAQKYGDEGWDPIPYFRGILLGNNHKISGLMINRPSEDYVGLFSNVAEVSDWDGSVSDLELECLDILGDKFVGCLAGQTSRALIKNCHVRICDGCKITGNSYVGGVVGTGGWMENVTAWGQVGDSVAQNSVNIGGIFGSVSSTTYANGKKYMPKNVVFNGAVYGKENVGGIAGRSSGDIDNAKAIGGICGNVNVGGIVGVLQGDYAYTKNRCPQLDNCIHTGIVLSKGNNIGGVAGSIDQLGAIYRCHHTGNIKGFDYVGGICGRNVTYKSEYSSSSIYGGAYISQSSSTANIEGNDYVGGLSGYLSTTAISGQGNISVNNSFFTGNIQGHNYIGGIVGRADPIQNTDINKCYALTEYVKGCQRVGGLAGYSSVMSDCFSICSIILASDYLAGKITGDGEVYLSGGNIENKKCSSLSTAKVYIKGMLVEDKRTFEDGYTITDQALKQKGTYTDHSWDFSEYWAIDDEQSYPYLKREDSIPVEGISLNHTSLVLEIGESVNLVASISPITAAGSPIKWASDDPEIASVNNGLIVAKKEGNVRIVVLNEASGVKAVCNVKVIYPKGYRISYIPFRLGDASATTSILFDTDENAAAPIKTLDFDVHFPKDWYERTMFDVAISNERIYSVKTLTDNQDGSYHFTLTVKDENNYFGSLNRKMSKLGSVTLYKKSEDSSYTISDGMKLFHIDNVIATDAEGNAYKVTPYAGDIYVGDVTPPVEDGKISFNGDYSDRSALDLMNKAISATSTSVTSIDLTNVNAIENGAIINTPNPNALILSPTNLRLGNKHNVVTDSICDNLLLLDGYDFATPIAFHANNVSYQRETSRMWGTVCLPYSIRSNTKVQYYALANVDCSKQQMLFKPIDKVAAGMPAVYNLINDTEVLDANATSVDVSKEANTIENTTEDWSIVGTFNGRNINPKSMVNRIYYIAENKFWLANETFEVGSFRAWFVTNETMDSEPRTFSIGIDAPITRVTEVKTESKKNSGIFDISGRQMITPVRGQLYIINGKKIYVK